MDWGLSLLYSSGVQSITLDKFFLWAGTGLRELQFALLQKKKKASDWTTFIQIFPDEKEIVAQKTMVE